MALPPPPKTPPRFVPTLTEVVQVPGSAPAPRAPAAPLRTTVLPPSMLPGARPPANPAPPAVQPAVPPLHGARASAEVPQRLASPAQGPGAHASPRMTPVGHSVAAGAAQKTAQQALVRPLPEGMEEYMVHRVMQRVDVVLDQRLREAIATVVQEQTRSVLPRLREEIESVVRHAVYEAVADELASGAPSVPKR